MVLVPTVLSTNIHNTLSEMQSVLGGISGCNFLHGFFFSKHSPSSASSEQLKTVNGNVRSPATPQSVRKG